MLLDHVRGEVLARAFRAVFMARRSQARLSAHGGLLARARQERDAAERERERGRRARAGERRRNILFITSDQQRFDALGCNGGVVARTPVVDALARQGINYRRAHVQNVVCMPSRSTMLTGQYPLTHGVVANGVPLPSDAPSVARHLRRGAGYHTALIGKAHFEPHLDPWLSFDENRAAAAGSCGPWRGFDHIELATHGPAGGHHYAAWLWDQHPEAIAGFGGVLTGRGGGDTGAPEVAHNDMAREHYHTDWVADRTVAWLDGVPSDEPWFCWMSFPDPHHPFDPPLDEVRARIDWRDVPLPGGHPGSRANIERILAGKPRHWLDWYRGAFRNPEGGPVSFVPSRLSESQLREMNAMIHVENELIDEACGRVLAALRARGVDEHTDVIYTSDHGELQGDFGLMFKGPYHTDALLRVPLVWRPAPSAHESPASIDEPVGHIDLAPTFCTIAGVNVPDDMQGAPLPLTAGSGRDAVITTFDSQFSRVGMRLRTIYADGHICTVYLPTDHRRGGGFPLYWAVWGSHTRVPDYSGTEGELYDVADDPHQWHNHFDDPSRRALRAALIDRMAELLPEERTPPLAVAAPT
jgi:arylsulfatase A-like enzyme